ncbi:MAG: hypothetical protein QOF78_3603 [Phycisphaerales bacterium]|jgi:hypothetical protein|nr:hypothetical protein [Phycisphaerales bacterium]
MRRFLLLTLTALIIAAFAPFTRADFPKPSPYPKTWELSFEHGKPQRVVVQDAKTNVPRAYWYMTYQVTNNSDNEQPFLPAFELVTEDGRIVRNDINIPRPVFEEIKRREGSRYMEPAALIAGKLRIGPDEAKDGVAIWPEPTAEMGRFNVFVSGLSGEIATVKVPTTKPVILHKTLQLNYLVRGDEVYPGEDEVNENPSQWVMR